MVRDHFWKNTFLTHFWSQNGPFSRHFGIFHGPKRVTTGSKRAKNTCLSIPNGPRSLLEKHIFDPFLSHFWSQNGPFSMHFGIFRGPKCVTTGSKRPKNNCLSIPSGRGTTLEKMVFFAPRTPMHPPLAPAVRGPSCPPAPPSEHWYRGLGGSLGNSEGWKPQKVGGCGWNRCPWNSVLSHVAQDTARSWFWACLTQTSHIEAIFGHFWVNSRTFCGARGQERALGHGAIEVHVECSNRFSSSGRVDWVSGLFWAKNGGVGHKMRSFGRAPPDLAPPPRGATGEFLAQNLDLARAPPRLYDG